MPILLSLNGGGGKCKRGADKHYDLMSVNEIYDYFKTEVYPLLDDDCHAYIWVTNNYLEAGLEILKQLGFRYITNIVWVKDKFGLGQYFRGQHEICLFGVKGKFTSLSRKESTLIKWKRTKHSQKPYEMYRKIEAVSDVPRLEVFARHRREGWDCLGNETPKTIQKLL